MDYAQEGWYQATHPMTERTPRIDIQTQGLPSPNYCPVVQEADITSFQNGVTTAPLCTSDIVYSSSKAGHHQRHIVEPIQQYDPTPSMVRQSGKPRSDFHCGSAHILPPNTQGMHQSYGLLEEYRYPKRNTATEVKERTQSRYSRPTPSSGIPQPLSLPPNASPSSLSSSSSSSSSRSLGCWSYDCTSCGASLKSKQSLEGNVLPPPQ